MMLRPSQFQSNSGNSADSDKTFKLKPSTLSVSAASSPLEHDLDSVNTSINPSSTENTFKSGNPFVNPFDKDEESPKKTNEVEKKSEDKEDENSDPLTKLNTKSAATLPKSNLFNAKATSFTSNAGFVFGQNISERVTGTKSDSTEEPLQTTNHLNESADGTSSGLLFSSGITNNSTVEIIEHKEVDGQSLLEATRKYEEKFKVQKRKYEEVETKTGEEDERNVYEVNCKVFAFVASNYEERGRGTLRLNDSKVKAHESRVVFRTSGNLRVLINTKIWVGMVATKASNKSLRMTAIDKEGHIKVFLVMSRPEDIEQLYKHLNDRINKLKQIEEENEIKSQNMGSKNVSDVANTSKSNESNERENDGVIFDSNGQDGKKVMKSP